MSLPQRGNDCASDNTIRRLKNEPTRRMQLTPPKRDDAHRGQIGWSCRPTFFMLGCIGWLLPFTWIGTKLGHLPFRIPDRLWQQYATAGLFTLRTSSWTDWRIEVRFHGSDDWRGLDWDDVSSMPASGYRQRIDRILGDTRSKKISENLRARLAGWIAQRIKQAAGREVAGVRYYHRAWPTNTPEMAQPAGHWDGSGSLPATTKVTLLGTYAIVDGKPMLERAKPRAPVVPQPAIFRRQPKEQPPAKP